MLGHLKDACYTLPNTQLTIATKYLHANEQSVGLVTIEMGFNNIRPCMLVPVFVPACAAQGITYVRDELPLIVRQLKAAAGPHVHFVGLEYADPFLASYLDGSTGRVNANENLAAFNQLNAVLQSVYSAAGIPIANVPGAFYSADATLVNLANVGLVPKNVFEACSFSWMCTKPPFGPDDHPNNAGYRIIANTIIPKLPKQW
jgi:lysophospholipase L1-like esterase